MAGLPEGPISAVVFAGNSDGFVDATRCRELAAELRALCGGGYGDPWLTAARLGIGVLVTNKLEAAAFAEYGRNVWLRADGTPGQEGLSLAAAIGQIALRSEPRWGPRDCWMVALEFLLPSEACRHSSIDELLELQPHAPPGVVVEWAMRLRLRSGSGIRRLSG